MTRSPVRVLIVDDSPTLRQIVRRKIEENPSIQVVGEAADPYEARSQIKALSPDVITLDIEMPRMNGLDFLEKLMRLRPMPVVMVSSLTKASTSAAIRAMQLGAVDCVGKPSDLLSATAFDSLSEKLLTAARAKPAHGRAPAPAELPPPAGAQDTTYDPGRRILLIGSSTGGVESLFSVFREFPANCPPTLVTQHIPAHFSTSFAARLDAHCAPKIVEAQHGMRVTPGMVVIAPGGDAHLEISSGLVCRLREDERVSGHRPSVDRLFTSALPLARRVSAALLTGMGRDGATGLGQLRAQGAYTIAQDQETSVVFGMPRAAIEEGAAIKVCPLERVAKTLLHAPIGSTSARRHAANE